MRDNKTRYSFNPDTAIFAENDNVLIAVDGIDGSGKTTVINILNKIMSENRFPTKALRITQSGSIAKAVSNFCVSDKDRRCKKDETILLAALQTSTIEECVFPELEKGNNVIIDRWLPSYFAYQVIANSEALADTIYNQHLNARYGNTNNLKTVDLYIYCYTDVEMSNYRIQNDLTREYAVFDHLSNLTKDVIIRGYDIYYDNFVGNKMILDTRYLSIDRIESILRDIIDSSGLEKPLDESVNSENNHNIREENKPNDPEKTLTDVTFPELDDLSCDKGSMCCGNKSIDTSEILRKIVESKDMEIMFEKMKKLAHSANNCSDDKPESIGLESIYKTISDASDELDIRVEITDKNRERDRMIEEGWAILQNGMRGVYQRNAVGKPVETQPQYDKLIPIVGQDLIDLIAKQKIIANPIKDFASLSAKTYDKKLLTEIDVRLSGFIRRELYRQQENSDRHHFATESNWENLFTDEHNGMQYAPDKQSYYLKLEPGEMILGKTLETFNLPHDIIAEFSLRSWTARSGINQSTSLLMKPNWSGQLVLELHNALQHHVVHLERNSVIGQVRFFRLGK